MYSAAKPYLSYEDQGITAVLLHRLCWLEPFWLVLLAIPITLPGLLPQGWQPLVVLGLFLFWPLHWLTARYTNTSFRLGHWSIAIILAWLPIPLLTAVNGDAAWRAAGYLALGLTLYVALINHPLLQQRATYLGWTLLLLTSGLLVIALPLVQWKSNFRLFYVPLYDWFQRIPIHVGETIHANILAGALVQLLAICLALALPSKVRTVHLPSAQHAGEEGDEESAHHKRLRIKRLRRDQVSQWIALLLTGLTALLLLLTQSRGAYLGAGVVVLGLLSWRWPRLALGLPLLVIGGAYLVYQLGAWSLFALLGADNTFGGAEWRTEVWSAAWQALHDFAYTGIGIGNFRAVLPLLYPNAAIADEAATHAHNLFLQIGLDLGLPGLLAWIGLIGTSMWRAVVNLRQPLSVDAILQHHQHESSRRQHRHLVHYVRRYNEQLALTAGALAALSGLLVHGMLDAVTWGTKLAFLPWLSLALIQLIRTRMDE